MNELQFAAEVERLHSFFEDWFDGRGDHTIEEFSNALDDTFFIVSPEGVKMSKRAIVGVVEQLHETGPVSIRVENISLESTTGELIIGTYEEHQERNGERKVRLSSVGMRVDPQAPGGIRWMFVHETWLPDATSSGLLGEGS